MMSAASSPRPPTQQRAVLSVIRILVLIGPGMRHVPALALRELGAYFASPLAYLVLIAIQILAFFNFWQLVERLKLGPVFVAGLSDPLNTYLSSSVQFWVTLMFALPALTMRLVAEEKRQGTLEGLLTAPIEEYEITLGKFAAGWVMALTLLLPYLIYLPFLHANYPFDTGPILSLLIGLATLSMMFTAIGLFFSALAASQVVAGIWTFATMFALTVLALFAHASAVNTRSEWAEVLEFLAVIHQLGEFGAGRLDPRLPALHLSVTVLLLFLTTLSLRNQRGR